MKKIFFIFLLFPFLLFAEQPIELQMLSNKNILPPIEYSKHCSNCSLSKLSNQTECGHSLKYFTDETLSNTIYNYLTGDKLINHCLSKNIILQGNFEQNENTLNNLLGQNIYFPKAITKECLKEKNNSPNLNKILSTYNHLLIKNIEDTQVNEIREMASINRLLGHSPLYDFECPTKFQEQCLKMQSCPLKNEFSEIVDFSISALNEIAILEKQRDELWRFQMNGKITSKESSEGILDINKKIDMLKRMLPWTNGDILKKNLSSILSLIKTNHAEDAKKFFESKFKEQLVDSKTEIKKRYFENNVSYDCITKNIGCSKKVLSSLNDKILTDYSVTNFSPENFNQSIHKNSMTYANFLEANHLLNSSYCIANLLRDKKEMDEISFMVASTGVSFIAGGVGGVLRLGEIALKFYKAGNRIKGLSSTALLAAEGVSIHKTFDDIGIECQKSLHNLENENTQSNNNCSGDSANIYKITNLKSCVINISATTLPYALSLRAITKKSGPLPYYEKELSEINSEKVLFMQRINNNFFTKKEKEELAAALSKIKLTPTESEDIINNLNSIIKNDKDKNRLKNYVNFVLSLKPNDQRLAIQKLNEVVLVSNHFNPGGFVQQFFVKENKFYLYEKYKAEYLSKKLELEGKSPGLAKSEAETLARESRLELQKKFYACQSKTLTPEHISAAKKYALFSAVMGVGGTTYGFYNNNKEMLNSNKDEFFGKLTYEIAMTFLITKINAKIMTNPEGSLLHKYAATNASSAMLGSIDASVYSKLYGVTEDEARIKIEEILSSPDAKKELEILDKYINKENLIEKFENNIIDTYAKIISAKNKDEIATATQLDKEFSHLTREELNNPEVKNKLVKAALLHLNSGSMSAFLSSGDKGFDRWINDRSWNAIIGVPKGLALGYGIYQILCLGADSPYLSLGIASSIQFTNQILSGDGYYRFRQSLIGQ